MRIFCCCSVVQQGESRLSIPQSRRRGRAGCLEFNSQASLCPVMYVPAYLITYYPALYNFTNKKTCLFSRPNRILDTFQSARATAAVLQQPFSCRYCRHHKPSMNNGGEIIRTSQHAPVRLTVWNLFDDFNSLSLSVSYLVDFSSYSNMSVCYCLFNEREQQTSDLRTERLPHGHHRQIRRKNTLAAELILQRKRRWHDCWK